MDRPLRIPNHPWHHPFSSCRTLPPNQEIAQQRVRKFGPLDLRARRLDRPLVRARAPLRSPRAGIRPAPKSCTSAGCTNPLQIGPNWPEITFSGTKTPQNALKYPLSGNDLQGCSGVPAEGPQTADFARFLKDRCIRAAGMEPIRNFTSPPTPLVLRSNINDLLASFERQLSHPMACHPGADAAHPGAGPAGRRLFRLPELTNSGLPDLRVHNLSG